MFVSIGEGSTTVNVSQKVTEKYGRTIYTQLHVQRVESWLRNGVALCPHEECVTCLHQVFQIDYG